MVDVGRAKRLIERLRNSSALALLFWRFKKVDERRVNLLTLDSVMLNNARIDVTVISDAFSLIRRCSGSSGNRSLTGLRFCYLRLGLATR